MIDKRPQLSPHCSPLNVPFRNRLEILVVMFHVSSIGLFTIAALFIVTTPKLYFLVIPYFIYFFIDRTPANGNVVKRYSIKMRSLPIWNLYCTYFPIKLFKTVDLEPTFTKDPNGSKMLPTGPTYIFCYHPHGIGSLGAFGALGTEGCNYSKKFPGIPISLMTLVNQFSIPVYRDYLLSLGITSVSKKNSLQCLKKKQSICIVLGGARESLIPYNPKHVDIILRRRRGFVKLAIQTGNVSLVPVFAYGETKTYKVVDARKNSMINGFQLWFKATFGFTLPLFHARGFFNYDFGLLPFRTPINVVTGPPIHVKEKYAIPPEDLVNKYHELYETELKKLYLAHRDEFGFKDMDLRIVG